MILPFDETGHFTCSQKRTFSLANDTAGLPVIRALRHPMRPKNHLAITKQSCNVEHRE
jgi:hypothetical protein